MTLQSGVSLIAVDDIVLPQPYIFLRPQAVQFLGVSFEKLRLA